MPDNRATKHGGRRWHFRGRTVGPEGSPRSSTHGGRSPAKTTYTVDDSHVAAMPTKQTAGRFKVGPPTKKEHRHGYYRNIS
jgi:hypothetical protein